MFAFEDAILRYQDLGVDWLVLVAPRSRELALEFVAHFAPMLNQVGGKICRRRENCVSSHH